MKLIRRLFRFFAMGLLGLLMLMVLSFALVQTKWAKEKVRLFLIQKVEEQDIVLSIETVEGILPFQWRLKKVSVERVGQAPFFCEMIKARLALLPLFSKQVIFSHFRLDRANYKKIPFNINAKVALSFRPDHPFALSVFEVSNRELEISGEAYLGRELELQSAKAHFSCDSLSDFASLFPFDIAGSFKGYCEYSSNQLEIHFSAEALRLQNYLFSSGQLAVKGKRRENLWNGHAEISLENSALDFKGATTFKWDLFSKKLELENFSMTSDDAQLRGDLALRWKERALEGALLIQIPHLSRFQPLFPASQLNGSLGAELCFHDHALELELQTRDLILFDKAIRSSTLNGELFNFFDDPVGKLSFEASGIEMPDLSISSLVYETQVTLTDCPFELAFQGKWKEDFQVETKGAGNASRMASLRL